MPSRRAFEDNGRYLGYAYLLKRYVDDPAPGDARADRQGGLGHGADRVAAVLVVPPDGGPRLLLHRPDGRRSSGSPRRASSIATLGCCRLAFFSIPLPWIAAELGWFVAEFGRQPWIIEGVLPTAIGVSDLGVWQVALTIFGFVLFYSVLAVVEVALLVKYIRLGPQPETEMAGGPAARRRGVGP